MSNVKSWKINSTEIGKIIGGTKSKTKIYVSAIMPLIKYSKAKIKSFTLNKSCYINAESCKVTFGNIVKTQNYITLDQYLNSGIESGDIKFGTSVNVSIPNKNIDKMHIANKL